MDFLVVNYPNDALIKFEEVSYLIKHGDHNKLYQFLRSSAKKYNAHHDSSLAKSMQPYFDKISKFYSSNVEVQAEGDEGAGASGSGPVGFIPDIVSDNKNIY